MATIKEVAAAAGVSLGTASNVINGKTNNIELIEKVEQAIRQLDYRPDGKARSLKSAHTFLIGVIVDSLKDHNTRQLLSALERQFRSRGYSIVIRTSGNNAVLESKNMEYFIQLGVDGIIVNTSLKKKSWLKKMKDQNLPIVFITRSTFIHKKIDTINISHLHAMNHLFQWCETNQKKKTGIIMEMASISMKEMKLAAKENNTNVVYKIVGDNSGESGFKAAYELLYENPDIDNIVIGSTMLAKGVQKALGIMGLQDELSMICITSDNWIENNGVYDGIIEISDYDIGCIASNRLLERIDQNEMASSKKTTVYSEFKEKKQSLYENISRNKDTHPSINIALLDSETSNVLKMLSEVYEKNSGINLNFHFYNYYELWNLIQNPGKLADQNIDIFMYDILWKDALIEKKLLQDLTYLLSEHGGYFEDYIDHITENFCLHENKLYGLPFMTGTQLLIYQKDLFEDNLLKIQYKRRYGNDLRIPQNWDEFNQVAEFFTKSYNDKSPVSYGTALINQGNLYNSIDFLNRSWSFEEIGNDTDTGETNHKQVGNDTDPGEYNHEQIKKALDNYKIAFQYSNPSVNSNTWEDVANEFKKGDVAMVVLYDSFAFGINDAMISKVAGNVGSAMIPGGNPVLGGWGLGLPLREGEVTNAVREYLMWSCGPEIAEPFSILSGTSSRKSFYANKEATGLYPWKDQVLDSYSRSRHRKSYKQDGKRIDNIEFYDQRIGKALGNFIRGEETPEDIIKMFANFNTDHN